MRYLMMGLLLACVAAPLRAEDAPAASAAQKAEAATYRFSGSVLAWFEHVKQGLSESSVSTRYQQRHLVAVAAVRGAAQEDVDPTQPVWKSAVADKKSKALRAQRRELAAAVDDILAGKTDEGRAKLDAFAKAHPDSPMLADAREIRGKLDEAVKAQDEALAKAGKAKP